jgi:hypothetical protein
VAKGFLRVVNLGNVGEGGGRYFSMRSIMKNIGGKRECGEY